MDTPTQELLATGLVQDPGAILLVIGVAGHWDLRPEDVPKLRLHFREVISEMHGDHAAHAIAADLRRRRARPDPGHGQ